MILDSILNRRSALAFAKRTVEPEKLTIIFEAAHLAPSSNNNQPWRFIYATQENLGEFKLLFDCLTEWNQNWVKDVPVLVLTIAEMVSSYKNYPNKYAWHDTGMATALLMIQAQALGLHTHPMGGFDPEKAKKDLHISDPYQPVAMLALGYPGNVQELPEDLMKRETAARNRKPLEDLVFKGKFGK